MSDEGQVERLKDASRRLVAAVMSDPGGFSMDTLHSLHELSEAAGLPDYMGVVSATGWKISGEGEGNVRFFGAAAHINLENQ